jgi:long-chain-fatty-acid--CoA ligase ACSBG
VLPANSLTATYPDGTVELRSASSTTTTTSLRMGGKDPSCQEKPVSVWTMMNETADRVPDGIALAVKRNDVWVKWTYREYREDVKAVAKAFIKLGLKPHHSVGILGFNAPEWHISSVASVCAGGLAAGIYTTNRSVQPGCTVCLSCTVSPVWTPHATWRSIAGPTSWWWR